MVMPCSFTKQDEQELWMRWRIEKQKIATIARDMDKSPAAVRRQLVKQGLRPPTPSDLDRMRRAKETVVRKCLCCRNPFNAEKYIFVCQPCKGTVAWR